MSEPSIDLLEDARRFVHPRNTESKALSQLEYEIEHLITRAHEDGQASCAPWMQHRPDCDLNKPWDSEPLKHLVWCSCGLSAHLAKGGT